VTGGGRFDNRGALFPNAGERGWEVLVFWARWMTTREQASLRIGPPKSEEGGGGKNRSQRRCPLAGKLSFNVDSGNVFREG